MVKHPASACQGGDLGSLPEEVYFFCCPNTRAHPVLFYVSMSFHLNGKYPTEMPLHLNHWAGKNPEM